MGSGGPGVLTEEQHAELEALVQLRMLSGVGDRGADRLLQRFGSAEAAMRASPPAFGTVVGAPAERARRQIGSGHRDEARVVLDRARRAGMVSVGRGLPGYPSTLNCLADPPPVIFLRGRCELLRQNAVTVVGTRRATGAGRRFATELGRQLSVHGVPVVSGLALGIDGAAHRGALGGPGSTIAVLASGIDRAHPSSHRRLQERIGAEGLLVTEFLPGESARTHHFPRRNRILAALGRDVVVVEAGLRSGALITVEHALDLGRDVYAVPGAVEYEQSRGVNRLLREGASALAEPADLLEIWAQVGIPFPGGPRMEGMDAPEAADPLGLLGVLGRRPMTAEEVATRAGGAARLVLAALSELELDGAVIRTSEGWRLPRREERLPARIRRIGSRLRARSHRSGLEPE